MSEYGLYLYEKQPDHPNAKQNGWVRQHLLVMSRHLGRPIDTEAGEMVHHKNGNKHDNSIENLELCLSLQPPGQRVEDLIPYAAEILRRYAPQLLTQKLPLDPHPKL